MGLKLPAFDSIEKSHHIMVGSTVDLTGEKDPKERDYKIWKATPWSELKPGSLASDGIKFPDLTVIAPGHLPGFSRLWQTLLIAFLLAAGTYAKLIEE